MTRILITSALPYINGVKHLGNLVGSMLPADVYARFERARGAEALFICATDEHGTPAELAARAAGQTAEEYCAEQHEIQKRAGEAFGLSFDHFGRSSNPPNHRLTQHFAAVLEERGLIEERVDEQIYSLDDQRFLPDRYVEGTCPECGYEKARGDQCDNCGRLLDPVDLINPYSAISGSRNLEARKTRHLYLLQSKMQDRIAAWVDSKKDWPALTRSIAHKWLKEGLKDRSITRDLYWGVKVVKDGKPRPGFEHKVFYVWFDAPIEYIGATVEWAEATGGDWRRWWRLDEGAGDVRYVQFMGKDNVAFHTVSFPCTILGSEEPWKTVDTLKSLNWLTWYGGKFSTSQNRGIFMDQALELLPADYWRWHLMANAPESDDASFTLEHFASVVNKDLADVLGNFVNRITRFCAARFGEAVPGDDAYGEAEAALVAELDRRLKAYTAHLEEMEFRKAFVELRAIWAAGNEYLQIAAPWTKIKEDRAAAAASTRAALNLIVFFAALSQPVIPFTAEKMFAIFGLDAKEAGRWPTDAKAALDYLEPGRPFTPPEVLFRKIEDEQIAEWREKFGAPVE
ncbi:methionine--tRNA ligase [Amphiplicatus metriothermophilus]|uniref:Methionine--tRNA ligase n=1 Tax=Amphiplicatus metriothermophilus TaxID=1519374 RepID=A0A239PV85_9PROT|nr:methionine--tRNA ligase [Amphiplicatus metriothermophilus]MBB5519601.1 methionyl-tRNA synthetase [Amphiplicatus metriothermophilus]SNT74165.1 methionyl-tRNA synthetase [Amphiplicatus metriothermophilus]